MASDDGTLETPIGYELPTISDYGGLLDITQACFGTGGEDGANKGYSPLQIFSVPYGGDPVFCQ